MSQSGASSGVMRRAFALLRPHRGQMAAIAVFISLAVVARLMPAVLLIEVINHALPEGDRGRLVELVLAILVLAGCSEAFGAIESWLSNDVSQQVMHRVRVDVFQHLRSLPVSFFSGNRGGEVQARLTSDVASLDGILTGTFSAMLWSLTTLAAATAVMVAVEWRLALLAVALMPMHYLVVRSVSRRRRRLTMQRQDNMASLTGELAEALSVSGVTLAKTVGAEEIDERFRRRSLMLARAEFRQRLAGRWAYSAIGLSYAAMPAVLYLYAGGVLPGSHRIEVGTLLGFTALQSMAAQPLGSLVDLTAEVQIASALFGRVFATLDLKRDAEPGGPVPLRRGRGGARLELRDVQFSYPNGRQVLNGASLTLEPGSTVALTGASGSGKSTLALIAAGLQRATSGSVLLNGCELTRASRCHVRQRVGLVTQDVHLIHDTLAENLLIASPDATDRQLEEALFIACLGDLVERLPDGLDTMVGERGFHLSGGERQRLAIARLLLRDPELVILDEATSALDAATERAIDEAVHNLSVDRTTLVIAHRATTLARADEVLMLDDGRVERLGTLADALSVSGSLRHLLDVAGLSAPDAARVP